MQREGVSTLSICGFPRTLRGLLFFKNAFVHYVVSRNSRERIHSVFEMSFEK